MKHMLALILAVCMTLSGCSLAVEGQHSGGLVTEDRLVGVVVTTEYLDLLDLEGFFADHPQALVNGGMIDTTGYEQRLYAQEVEEQTTNEFGENCTVKQYNFDHVDGIPLLHYLCNVMKEDGTVVSSYTTGTCGEGLWDVTFGGSYAEGTIYLPEGTGGETVFYLNEVYQDADGKVYLLPGTGISSSAGTGSMWQSVKQEYTITVDGEQKTQTQEYKIHIKWVPAADTVTILQMNADHQILQQAEYTPETVPGEIIPETGCAYILVEQRTGDKMTRTILQPGGENLTVYRRTDKPYCSGTVLDIRWAE